MGAIKYRPQASRFSKKQSEEQNKKHREELISLGLDDDSARAVLAVSHADRLDFQVRANVLCAAPTLSIHHSS
jgi:hypothetical protein